MTQNFMARGDYSQIEARVICWLAGAEWKLAAFRQYDTITGYTAKGKPIRFGPDIYKTAAAGIYGIPIPNVTDEIRQTGKVSELALGFAGGPDALQNMAKLYRMAIPRHPRLPGGMADRSVYPASGSDLWIVNRWRASNPEIRALWAAMEHGAISCMQSSPGTFYPLRYAPSLDGGGIHPAGEIGVGFTRTARALALRLPSGRSLLYWSPRLSMRALPWGGERLALIYRAEDSVTKRWQEFTAYGGLLAQNPTQAIARDIMADALIRLERAGCCPVLTVHDEAVCDYPAPGAAAAVERIATVMQVTPPWAAGLPVAVDCSAGRRYQK